MSSFQEDLKCHLEGPVHFDAVTRRVYSVDASIFEVEPLAVAIPSSQDDLLKAIQIAYHHQVPITVRGAATGITGGCLGRGLILDVSKALNRILKIDVEKRYVICEPGVVQDDLNQKLAPYGLRLGPDTSTGNRATLGGMLANNAAGSRSLRFGKMVDAVQGVELALADGERLYFEELDEEEWTLKQRLPTIEGHLYREVEHIRKTYEHDIEAHFPRIPRRASGYNLDELLKPYPLNLAKLIAGSEGTLGIATQIKLAVVPKIRASGLCLLFFDDLLTAMRQVPHLLTYAPTALELIDNQIIELGRQSPSLRGQLDWLKTTPQALLIMELEGDNESQVRERLYHVLSQLQQKQIGYMQVALLDPLQMAHMWALRKSGLGLLLSKRTYSRAIAFLEDISVAPEHLPDFMEAFCRYLASKGKKAGIYGHVGSGCMHVRPYINLQDPQEVALMRQMMKDVAQVLLKFGGALSGEHGDGWIRSWLNPTMFGEPLMQAFRELKHAFDPQNLLNPGKIVPLSQEFEEMRSQAGETLKEIPTFLNFEPEGGLTLAADLCNGNGLCRKKEHVMCPSFQVTNEEFHSTRARAQTLRAIFHGRLPLESLTSQRVHDVMDLCISCKGCKTECPSQVDMAKMKAEFLYHYQEEHGYSLRTRLFGAIGYFNSWMSPLVSLVNAAQKQPFIRNLMDKWMGIAPQRPLPTLARERFSAWFKQWNQEAATPVVLFNDTFNEFNNPHIGQAAVHVLNACGYLALVPKWICCGRPYLSKGMLKQARGQAKQLIQHLMPYVQQGLPIIGLEPSCLLTLKDDYAGLFPTDDPFYQMAQKLALACLTFDEFLARHAQDSRFLSLFQPRERSVHVHGHCHQKALVGMQPTITLLRAIPGFQVVEIASGCCGMAGSFGYESEHYTISMQMGELRLFPAVRPLPSDAWVVANGMSCRHQIMDGTEREALHLAEVLSLQLENGRGLIPI